MLRSEKTKYVFVMLMLWFATTIHAAESLSANAVEKKDPKPNKTISELQLLLGKFEFFSAHFEQKLIGSKGKELQHLSGRLQLKKPNLLNWQAKEPYLQQVLADGKKVWLYDADLEQVTVKPMTNDLSQAPALILAGEFDAITQQYTVKKIATGHFSLLPKQNNPLFKALELKFDKAQLADLLIIDKLGQITHIKLKNYDAKTPINDDVFRFVVPPETDVLNDA